MQMGNKPVIKCRLSLLFLTAFFIFLCSGFSSAQTLRFVRWVDDGDTIVLENGIRVRYIGINAPETAHDNQPAEPYGYAAKKLNKSLVFRKKVRLELDRERFDRHNRQLAYVFLKKGLFINAELVRQGYAYCLPRGKNFKYRDLLLRSQRDAMSAKRGIWNNWEERNSRYLGSRVSKRFHLKTCPYAKKIAKRNRIYFRKKWEAFWAGFAPGKQCLKEYWRSGKE